MRPAVWLLLFYTKLIDFSSNCHNSFYYSYFLHWCYRLIILLLITLIIIIIYFCIMLVCTIELIIMIWVSWVINHKILWAFKVLNIALFRTIMCTIYCYKAIILHLCLILLHYLRSYIILLHYYYYTLYIDTTTLIIFVT